MSPIKWCVDHIYSFYGSIYVKFTKIGQKSIAGLGPHNRYKLSGFYPLTLQQGHLVTPFTFTLNGEWNVSINPFIIRRVLCKL